MNNPVLAELVGESSDAKDFAPLQSAIQVYGDCVTSLNSCSDDGCPAGEAAVQRTLAAAWDLICAAVNLHTALAISHVLAGSVRAIAQGAAREA